MSRPYFDYIPNFEYVSRTKDGKNISDYTVVKNLFKRGLPKNIIFGAPRFVWGAKKDTKIMTLSKHEQV